MKLNQAGIDLIKSFESCRLTAYQDIVGRWTIGWGHTGPEVHAGLAWTQQQADDNLAETLQHVADAITPHVSADLNDNQFSACVCLAYNIGIHAFTTSTLCSYLAPGSWYLENQDKWQTIANEFPKWDRAKGQEVPGLLRRRMAEKALFLTPV